MSLQPARRLLILVHHLLAMAIFAMTFIFVVARPGGSHGRIDLRLPLAELLLAPLALLMLKRFRWRAFLSPIAGLVLLLCLAIAGSALANPSRASLFEAVQWIGSLLLGYGVVGQALRIRFVTLPRLAAILALAALVSALLALGQKMAGVPDFFIRGGFVNAQGYGFFLALGFPLIAWLLARRLRPTAPASTIISAVALALSTTLRDTGLLIAFVLATLFSLCPLLTGGRRWLLLPLALLVLTLHTWLYPAEIRRFIIPYEITDFKAAFAYNYHLAYPSLGSGVPLSRSRGLTLYPPAASLRGEQPAPPALAFDRSVLKQRQAEWLAALRMWSHAPLAGVGPGNYQARIGEFYAPLPKLNSAEPDSQNGWLVLGSSIGLAGFLALAGALLLGITSNWPVKSSRLGPASPATFLPASALGVLVTGTFTPLTQVGLWPLVAVLLALLDYSSSARAGQALLFFDAPSSKWIRISLATMLLAALGLLIPQAGERLANRHIYLWQEAEQARRITLPMTLESDPEASGGRMVALARGIGAGWRKEAGGAAAYEFQLPEAGRYDLWVRVRWLDGCGNTFFLKLGQGPGRIVGNDAEFGAWHWIKAGSFRLEQGMAHFEFANREDGVALDKLLLTGDGDFRPEGCWQRVYSSDLAEEPLRGWTAQGQAARNDWQAVPAGKSRGRVLEYQDAPRPGAALLVSDPLREDFRLDCRFQLADRRGDLRLIVLSQDSENFLGLDLSGSRACLRRFRDGHAEELTSVTLPAPLRVGAASTLTVFFRGGIVTAELDGKRLLEHIERRLLAGQCGFASLRGGVRVQTLELRPAEAIYYLYDPAGAPPAVGAPTTLKVGGANWSNVGIELDLESQAPPPEIGFNIDPQVDRRLSFQLKRGACTLRSMLHGRAEEEHTIPLSSTIPWPPVRLALRAFAREVTLLLNGREVGHAVFTGESSLRGAVEFPTRGVRRAEVKGLRHFYDGFGGCDGNNTASWEMPAGRWKVVRDAEAGLEDCLGQLAGGAALALTGEATWEHYEARCQLRSSGGGAFGLVYHYQDAENYDAVRWTAPGSALPAAGQLQLIRRRAGREAICAQARLDCQGDRWYELRVITPAVGEEVWIDGRPVLAAAPSDLSRGRIGLACEQNPGAFFDNVRVDFY